MPVIEELERIMASHDGMLYPKDVVDFARDESTELHKRFEWDDDVAGENYRIWQARQIIRLEVRIIPRKNDPITVSAFVSMKQDRYQKTENSPDIMGGYRSMIDVLQTPALRKTLLEEAIEEHDNWERKYQDIQELIEIFSAARTVKQKMLLVPEPISAQ
jgi:hypothetical protein